MTFAMLEGPDLIVVLVIVLLLFGGSKLPGLARSLGEAQREFHKGTRPEGQTTTPPALAAKPEPGPEPGPETVTLSRSEYDQLMERQRGEGPSAGGGRRAEPLRAPPEDRSSS